MLVAMELTPRQQRQLLKLVEDKANEYASTARSIRADREPEREGFAQMADRMRDEYVELARAIIETEPLVR